MFRQPVPREPVLSRHRLPRAYRRGLITLWLTPIALLFATILIGNGISGALLDPRLLVPLLLMALPAVYIRQEGVDVLPSGIVARVFWPRYYPYVALDTWHFDTRPDRRVLTVWHIEGGKALDSRAGHLTGLSALLRALHEHLPHRPWFRYPNHF